MHAEGEDADVGGDLTNAACGLDAVEFRHGDVHDDHVGLEFLRFLNGLVAVGSFADDLHVGMGGEDHAKSVADDGVVVGEQDLRDTGEHI